MELGGYEIIDKIAVGGMAEIYKARVTPAAQKAADEPDDVVIKRLLPSLRTEQKAIDLFVAEGKLTVRLRHPNVVRTFKLVKKGLDYLMIQELIEGATYDTIVEQARRRGLPLAIPAVLQGMTEVLKALDYVHRVKLPSGGGSIVHRDVNPANLLVAMDGFAKLTDFGVADAETNTAAEQGVLRGTIPYMSPEQVVGRKLDRRSDLYAVGVMLWESLAGRRLYDAPTDYDMMQKVRQGGAPLLSTLRSDIPELLLQITRKALFVDPKLRFQNATEFLTALSALTSRNRLAASSAALADELKRALAA